MVNEKIKIWEDDLSWILCRMLREEPMDYDSSREVAKEYAHRISLWLKYGFGDIFSFDEFSKAVKCGSFIDYDGNGYFINDKTGEEIKGVRCNYDWLIKNKPEDSNYIMWYNK